MTTTPQAALLSEAIKLANEFRVTMPREVLAIWGAEVQAELRRLDALVAHLTADRDDTANELALRTKHNLALTNERDLLAKLQATQEPVQAGELPDEREAFEATVLKGNPSAVLTKSRNGCYQDDELQVMWWAWQARSALSARKPLTPLTPAQMEKGRDQIFSINNPFCPCDSKTFSKVAEWVERHHGIGLEVKP